MFIQGSIATNSNVSITENTGTWDLSICFSVTGAMVERLDFYDLKAGVALQLLGIGVSLSTMPTTCSSHRLVFKKNIIRCTEENSFMI